MANRFEKIRKRKKRGRTEKWEWRSCKSKKRFSEWEAKSRAQKFDQRAYFCNLCSAWHLTSIVGEFHGGENE